MVITRFSFPLLYVIAAQQVFWPVVCSYNLLPHAFHSLPLINPFIYSSSSFAYLFFLLVSSSFFIPEKNDKERRNNNFIIESAKFEILDRFFFHKYRHPLKRGVCFNPLSPIIFRTCFAVHPYRAFRQVNLSRPCASFKYRCNEKV